VHARRREEGRGGIIASKVISKCIGRSRYATRSRTRIEESIQFLLWNDEECVLAAHILEEVTRVNELCVLLLLLVEFDFF